jgi:signal transduction histidine kinase
VILKVRANVPMGNAMDKPRQLQPPTISSRRWLALMVTLALVVLGGAILSSVWLLRLKLHESIADHDGRILHAVSLLQQMGDDSGTETAGSLSDPGAQLDLILNISRLQGVIGIRLFSPAGRFVNALPAYITEGELPRQDLSILESLKPVSHYHPNGRLEDVDLLAEAPRGVVTPLLIVNVPLHAKDQPQLLGVAQFILQGETLSQAFVELDRKLAWLAILVFLASGGMLTVALTFAFGKINRANRLLADRTASLLQANQELALAAKTSAVGAVAAHLIHGLKNPLSGLQGFVNHHGAGNGSARDPDWTEAVATTQRMQNLIGEVVRILGEQNSMAHYELSLEELAELIAARMTPVAEKLGVHFATQLEGSGTLSNREANLVALILENLIQNALQATPRSQSVLLSLVGSNGTVVFEVQDEGPGLPAVVREQLFAPCRSTKDGGSGIGLAISKQLATHLGGTLELKQSTGEGCVFRFALPLASANVSPPPAETIAGSNPSGLS